MLVLRRATALPRRSIRRFHHGNVITPVTTLQNATVESFRASAFEPAVPVALPHGSFPELPAVTKWFKPSGGDSEVLVLNQSYLSDYGETLVPLELTRLDSKTDGETFDRLNAPLSLFLEWTLQACHPSSERLYLAQASISDLPSAMREDVPVPDLVAKVGKGDIYDANIWIGLPPTYTPLHRDPNPNLFVQLAGSKVVRLFPPVVGLEIFRSIRQRLGEQASATMRGMEMMQGPERLMLEEEVWNSEAISKFAATVLEAQLNGGDALFIPKGWWHSIKGIGESITGSVNWWFR